VPESNLSSELNSGSISRFAKRNIATETRPVLGGLQINLPPARIRAKYTPMARIGSNCTLYSVPLGVRVRLRFGR
jgi:hypothetical protein